MNNATVSDMIVTTSVVPILSSEEDTGLSDGQVAGIVIMGAILLSGLVYFALLKVRSKRSADRTVANYGSVPTAGDGKIAVDVSQIYEE
jgi:hypothetical protein